MMKSRGHLMMSEKERNRKVFLEQVLEKQMTLKQASEKMGVSYRQGKRIIQRYRKDSDFGLVHRSRGKPSNRRISITKKQIIIDRYRSRYQGFGPTFASEKLAEDNLLVNAETLRLWLKKEGLWQLQRKRSPYRQYREPKAHFGELLQLDGSHHRWFGEDNKACCLMNLVDDASGICHALLANQETTAAAFQVLYEWIKIYGIPQAYFAI